MYQSKQRSWIKHIDFYILDILVLQGAFILAYFTRHGIHNLYRSELYRDAAFVLLLSDIIVATFFALYRDVLRRNYLQELRSVIFMVGGTGLFLLGYLFFTKSSEEFARSVVVWYVLYGIVLLWICRQLWKTWLLKKNVPIQKQRSILLVAPQEDLEKVIKTVEQQSFGKLRIIGIVAADDTLSVGDRVSGQEVLCSYNKLADYIQTRWVDEVLFALPRSMEVGDEILDQLYLMGITTHRVLNFASDRGAHQSVEDVAGYTCITESIRFASPLQVLLKRMMDIVGAVIGLILTAVLTVIIGPIIYFTDPGPIFFGQNRVGKNGRIFKMYKFRSMYRDAEARKEELVKKMHLEDQMMFKMEHDPRILGSGEDGTKKGIGWFIRKTSIDEFPQFWNVLKGDLSLVGTRPPTLDEWERYEPHHRARMAIKPGITGLWQVSGRSNISDFEEVVRLDMEYINHWGLAEDLKILAKTVKLVFTGEGAE